MGEVISVHLTNSYNGNQQNCWFLCCLVTEGDESELSESAWLLSRAVSLSASLCAALQHILAQLTNLKDEICMREFGY